ncbi:hypothetical protein [Pedobacter nyackensis]|uniref:Vitellogenin II n=1 Tax=Pedobacter nyackensis TaxID=475255 RepID=A0A1W2CQN5_9SPHI|nr:hypothetical protein [Pedobacter nyackensis]SMC87192.1 hypothetical protein SAMN04488101_104122 [Pedobacter nyackensis]
MKPIYLFTGMLALTTLVVSSCSAPRLAQQNSNDDVYNSVAQAKEYRQQVPVRESEYDDQEDDYGTSDPFYDMDYSSRINRFSYANPSFMGYYDPYFDGGWYGNYGMSLGFGMGFGYSPFYGSIWNSPYYGGWGNYYSPFYGYNNYYGNGYYGGGYYGGGLWGGGYWGGGFYTGRTTNVQDYRPRPNRGNNSYIGNRGTTSYMQPRSSRGQSAGSTISSGRPSRGDYNPATRPNTQGTRPSRTEGTRPTTRPSSESSRPSRTESRPATRPSSESSRPSRTESRPPARESYTPPPSYNPPSRSESGSGGGGSSGGGGGGGTSRPTRGGR